MNKEYFTFFWNGPFSQWAYSPFVVNGIKYTCAEMYMMWFKDQIFGGTLEQQILTAKTPAECKALGRQVPNFNKKIWESVARPAVFVGNMAKFTQNPGLLDSLFDTKGTTLVEASPVDKIWGIGLAEGDPLSLDRTTWEGTNWLGEVLTDVREHLFSAIKTADVNLRYNI